MERNNDKVVALGFLTASVLFGATIYVLLQVMASVWGAFGSLYSNETLREIISHGIPVASAVVLFAYLMGKQSIRTWGDEVVVELSRVVWPSRKDTTSMTIVVTVIILLAGALLGLFDLASTFIVKSLLSINLNS